MWWHWGGVRKKLTPQLVTVSDELIRLLELIYVG
jgi:hypothetical protein